MAMEIDLPKPEVLFRAAEDGDASLFASLSREALDRARSLRNEDGRSLLHVAASFGRFEASPHRCFANCVVDVISAADPSINGVNSKDEEGWAPIHSAASIGNAEIVEILLSRGGDVNLINDGGRTSLHYAASKGWLKVAEVLISHGAKINKKDKVGCTPLHRAASTGKSELCELLIEEGADVDVVDKAGQTPIMHAVICQNQQVALLLLRHGADLDVEDKEGYTALGRASDDFRRILIDAAKAMLEG
ncbi:unnamed protein product [Musa hybrid cultivar]